jgi:acyl-ACP thioesterase
MVLENSAKRTVGYTELDLNGHMNNTRYLDWVDDLLPSAFHKAHPVREFTVCYLAEALEGQEISLDYQLLDGPCLRVDAHRKRTSVDAGKERVFSVQLLF